MKKSMFNISICFLILGLCWISIIGNSQVLKLNRKEKKEAKKVEKLKDYETLGILLDRRKFTFESDRVQGSTGAKVYNVINVDGSEIFVRCEDPKNTSGRFSGALDNTIPRTSPRTGLFFEGDIQGWELSKDSKNLSYSIRFDVKTRSGTIYNITMKISATKSASIEIKNQSGANVYTNYSALIRAF